MSPSKFLKLATVIGVCTSWSVAANACPYPSAYTALEKWLFTKANESANPTDWVQFFVSSPCNNKEIERLFLPLFKKPGVAADPTSNFIPDKILLKGKFSGDESQTIEQKGNGEFLRSTRGGGHLSTIQIQSKVMVRNIPKLLYPSGYVVPPAEKDVALWIRYRCSLTGTGLTAWYGDPNNPAFEFATCAAAPGTSGVFDRVEIVLNGPYKRFFDFAVACEKSGPTGCDAAGGEMAAIKITLTPKPEIASFMKALTNGWVTTQ